MMADRETLQALLDRVMDAKGPDRELALAIGQALNDVPQHWRHNSEGHVVSTFDLVRDNECGWTESIDAALALVERVLPEWQGLYLSTEWTGMKRPGNGVTHRCTLRRGLHSNIVAESGERATAPLAILAALLRALISDAEEVAVSALARA